MDQLIPVVGTMALLGSALVGGILFAFSSFVMKALARVPSAEGIGAMQSINVVVLNPLVSGCVHGNGRGVARRGLARLGRLGSSLRGLLPGRGLSSTSWGTFLVTVLGNVPLNDQLAAVSATDPAARDVWEHYLGRWTLWNHVRTAAALVAALLYTLGLMQSGGT